MSWGQVKPFGKNLPSRPRAGKSVYPHFSHTNSCSSVSSCAVFAMYLVLGSSVHAYFPLRKILTRTSAMMIPPHLRRRRGHTHAWSRRLSQKGLWRPWAGRQQRCAHLKVFVMSCPKSMVLPPIFTT